MGRSYSARNNLLFQANPSRPAARITGVQPWVTFEDEDEADPTGRCRWRINGTHMVMESAKSAGWATVHELLDLDCDLDTVTIAGELIAEGLIRQHTVAGITASTTQTQGQGALTGVVNQVAVVANPNDTVTLPAAAAGRPSLVINNGANTLRLFPASGDNLGGGVDTATTIAAGEYRLYQAHDATTWTRIAGGAPTAHAATHSDGGADEITVENLATAAADGQMLVGAGSGALEFVDQDFTLNFIIDGGGSTITTGEKGHLELPFAGVIESVRLLADQSGSIVVDIWKDTYANFPPADADSITAAAPPTITTATKSEDATLTGWTTIFAAGDVLAFNVDSITTCQRVTVSIRGRRT